MSVECRQCSTAIRPSQESVQFTCCNKFFHRICTSITQTTYRQRKASSPNVDFCCRECTAAPVAESTRLSIGDATLPYADATVDPYSESTVVHRDQSFPSTPDLPNHDTSSVDLTRQTFSIAPESIEA